MLMEVASITLFLIIIKLETSVDLNKEIMYDVTEPTL